MKKYTCKLLGVKNPPIYELGFDEMRNMSIQYPMAVIINGKWKKLV